MKEQDFMRILGSNIRTSRISAGMTQGELAKAIGRSLASVSKYERGGCAIDSYTLCNIADTLTVTASQLLPERERPSMEASADSNWNIISQHDRYYLHNIGFLSQKLCCSQIDVDWGANEAVMYIDMYGQPRPNRPPQSNAILYGKVYTSSASTIIWVNNPVAPIDYFQIVINSAAWYAGKQVCYVSYATANWRSVASKGVITTTPERPANIEELITFTKDELKDIRKKNLVLF